VLRYVAIVLAALATTSALAETDAAQDRLKVALTHAVNGDQVISRETRSR
jgi:hypothetical protein